FFGVFERSVGFGDLFELVFGVGVFGHVGMVLMGQLAIGLLDFVLRGVAPHSEHFVVVNVFHSDSDGAGHGLTRRFALSAPASQPEPLATLRERLPSDYQQRRSLQSTEPAHARTRRACAVASQAAALRVWRLLWHRSGRMSRGGKVKARTTSLIPAQASALYGDNAENFLKGVRQ